VPRYLPKEIEMRPAPKDQFPTLDKSERKKVAVLEERRRYLAEKLASDDCSERARSYLKDERDAIDWALEEVASCHSMVTP
jgi:hypothetical protein